MDKTVAKRNTRLERMRLPDHIDDPSDDDNDELPGPFMITLEIWNYWIQQATFQPGELLFKLLGKL